jgi:signal transduction histidine kinase
VHVEMTGGLGSDRPGPDIPAPVAGAIVHATREALANVAAHAGTGEAWVTIALGCGTPAAGTPATGTPVTGTPVTGTPGAGILDVTVRDEGAGFDPARVDPARLGLRRSITERVADRGGRVSVRSAPGRGTLVSMRWPGVIPAPEAGLVAADSSW